MPPLTEAVVLHWAPPTGASPGDGEALVSGVGALLEAGVDVVVTGPVVSVLPPAIAAPTGPGRLFVWTTDPPEVHELGSSRRWPVAGERANEWARRHLMGPGAPGPVDVGPGVDGIAAPGIEALEDLARTASDLWQVVDDPCWRFEVQAVAPELERHVEACLTVANGRTGTRGSLEEGHPDSFPAVYVAGVFGYDEGPSPVPDLIRGPQWTALQPRTGGEPMDSNRGETLFNRRVLDLRHGTLVREWRQRLPSGEEWEFRSVRFASLADRRLLVLEAEVTDAPSPVALGCEVVVPEGQPAVAGVDTETLAGRHVLTVRGRDGGGARFAVATSDSGDRLRRLVTVERMPPAAGERPQPRAADTAGASGALDGVAQMPSSRLVASHRRAWRERWRDADVVIDGDARAQKALRFALYHLMSTGDPESDLASIGARGLSGPGYRGHVFWDTEVYILPFFTWTHPATARALLAYRYRTLPAARAKAQAMGYSGALYAWESADTGEECTPDHVLLPNGVRLEVLTGQQEHHISADVAWAVWHHWQVTGDDDFLAAMGAEMIVETARFWASRTETASGGRHHIRRVIGPDEYHETVDDSAYTNVMARWNLRTAARLRELVAPWDSLAARLGVTDEEIEHWGQVASGLVDGFSPDSLLYEQFAGFFDLEDVRAVDLAPRPFTGELVLGLDRLRRTQVVKQADVVMLARMLPEEVPIDVAAANYRYYEPRTSHGSSLSPAMHSLLAARLGDMSAAGSYFAMASAIDLDVRTGSAAQGLHVATMGGLWQAAVIGFGGVSAGSGQVLRIDPRLSSSWERLAFPLQWRGRRVQVEVRTDRLLVHLDGPATLAAGDRPGTAVGPGTYVSRRRHGRWSQLEPFGEGGPS